MIRACKYMKKTKNNVEISITKTTCQQFRLQKAVHRHTLDSIAFLFQG